jgi:GNAT superfamily N-acetyltransferase
MTPVSANDSEVTIIRLIDLEIRGTAMPPILAGIDKIFWATTSRTFTNDADRASFQHLWLGQFLERDREHAYLATTPTGHVAGYLVGCWTNPAQSQRFASLAYFQTFASACARYPVHLHINLDEAYRSRGIGRRLIDAFATATKAAGYPGIHVVTSAASRNVSFYNQCGFHQIASTTRSGTELIFLGRDLGA